MASSSGLTLAKLLRSINSSTSSSSRCKAKDRKQWALALTFLRQVKELLRDMETSGIGSTRSSSLLTRSSQ